MHPAKEGFSALPFFDEFDLSTVDILLISQYVDTFLCSCLAQCFPFTVERSLDLDGHEISTGGTIDLLSDTLHVYQSKCRYSTQFYWVFVSLYSVRSFIELFLHPLSSLLSRLSEC